MRVDKKEAKFTDEKVKETCESTYNYIRDLCCQLGTQLIVRGCRVLFWQGICVIVQSHLLLARDTDTTDPMWNEKKPWERRLIIFGIAVNWATACAAAKELTALGTLIP